MMNLKSIFGPALSIAGLTAGLLVAAPATAGIKGQMILDLTEGCFSYGAAGAPGCSNPDAAFKEYATGKYKFVDTLLAPLGGLPAGLGPLSLKPYSEPLAKLPHAIYCATQHSPSESDLCRARGLDSRAAKLMAWFSSFEANHCLHSSNARGRERERRRSFS